MTRFSKYFTLNEYRNFVIVVTGESFTADDGCNSCFCSRTEEGNLVATCTLMLCPDEPENQCVANGVTYQEGMSLHLLLQ